MSRQTKDTRGVVFALPTAVALSALARAEESCVVLSLAADLPATTAAAFIVAIPIGTARDLLNRPDVTTLRTKGVQRAHAKSFGRRLLDRLAIEALIRR